MWTTDQLYERTGLWLWRVSPALFIPYTNSTFLPESNVSSSEDVQPSTFSCISCFVFLYLFSVPHILCVYSLRPGSVHIWACGHHTVVCAHFTQTHPCSVTWHDGQSHVRLLWHSLYWVNGSLYCKNLSRIEVWAARGRSVRGMCQWKETVACREKILTNNVEWLCGVFRLCVYRYLRLLFVTRLSHWTWCSSTADMVKRNVI
jgi:hypothetical protein